MDRMVSLLEERDRALQEAARELAAREEARRAAEARADRLRQNLRREEARKAGDEDVAGALARAEERGRAEGAAEAAALRVRRPRHRGCRSRPPGCLLGVRQLTSYLTRPVRTATRSARRQRRKRRRMRPSVRWPACSGWWRLCAARRQRAGRAFPRPRSTSCGPSGEGGHSLCRPG